MKKALSILLLLTSFFLFSLVSCNSNNEAFVLSGVHKCIKIKNALEKYAAESAEHTYPPAIDDVETLVALCKENGANISLTEIEMALTFNSYSTRDNGSDYYCIFTVNGVPDYFIGKILEVEPEGIIRLTKDKLTVK